MLSFFEWLTVISFLLSSYLSLNKIYNSRVRVDIDNVSIHKGSNIFYLQFIINNRSSESAAITDVHISQKDNNAIAKAALYEKKIYYNINKTNGVANYKTEIVSNKLPVNLTPKSATTILLSFPLIEDELLKFNDGAAILDLKINGKHKTKEIYITSGKYLLEQLQKAATR